MGVSKSGRKRDSRPPARSENLPLTPVPVAATLVLFPSVPAVAISIANDPSRCVQRRHSDQRNGRSGQNKQLRSGVHECSSVQSHIKQRPRPRKVPKITIAKMGFQIAHWRRNGETSPAGSNGRAALRSSRSRSRRRGPSGMNAGRIAWAGPFSRRSVWASSSLAILRSSARAAASAPLAPWRAATSAGRSRTRPACLRPDPRSTSSRGDYNRWRQMALEDRDTATLALNRALAAHAERLKQRESASRMWAT